MSGVSSRTELHYIHRICILYMCDLHAILMKIKFVNNLNPLGSVLSEIFAHNRLNRTKPKKLLRLAKLADVFSCWLSWQRATKK